MNIKSYILEMQTLNYIERLQIKPIGKVINLILVVIAIELIPRSSAYMTNLLNPIIHNFDKDGVFLWISIHHLFQLFFTIILMMSFNKRLRYWGFNSYNASKTIRIAGLFILIFLSIEIIIAIALLSLGKTKPTFDYPLNFRNIFGYYSFEAFLSGTCEEPLFRSFAIIVLAQSWKGKFKFWKINFTHAGIIAAILFTYAHIFYSFNPFKLNLDFLQLVHAFGLGLLYAVVFEKTKSIYVPIIIHNLSNVIMISIPYFLYLIL